jgi:hypothetical protein
VYVLRAVGRTEVELDDAEWIEVGDLGVWASEWSGPREVTREGMLEHHRVVGLIHEKVDCLPVRFPTWSSDPTSEVMARAEALRAGLARIEGKAEFALTLVWDDVLTPGSGETGREFMAQRRAYWAARRGREQAVRAWAAQLPPDALVKLYPNERVALSAALLLPRGATPGVSAMPGTRLVLNGPWPPYSFATVE